MKIKTSRKKLNVFFEFSDSSIINQEAVQTLDRYLKISGINKLNTFNIYGQVPDTDYNADLLVQIDNALSACDTVVVLETVAVV